MTRKKELEELTDKAVIRRLFPKEVIGEAKRAAREAERKARTAPKKRKLKDLA